MSIGVAGTFKTHSAFLRWVATKQINSSLIVTILDHEVAIDGAVTALPNSHLIVYQGSAAPIGGVPTEADFTAIDGVTITNYAAALETDITAMKARYSGSITMNPALPNKVGLGWPHGIKLKNLLIISRASGYTIDVGFGGAHQNSMPGGQLALENTCHLGGKWGVISTGRVV